MTREQFLKQYSKLLTKHGSQRAVAKAVGIPRTTIQSWLAEPVTFSHRAPLKPRVIPVVHETQRFILTSAQDGTDIHEGFLANLEAYAEYMDASISVAGFTYNKRLFENHDKTNPNLSYHKRVRKYLETRQVQIGENVLWCAEMNTLPTAVTPLTGFEVYTRGKWGIFPHAKVQLTSIATMKHTPAKQLMTTGAVTLPNYVQKRDGIKAQFHHVIGAVIVEIDADGDHFCRHLLAEKDGSFYDLTRYVSDGVVTEGHRVEAITWGDIHLEQLDPEMARISWGLEQFEDGSWATYDIEDSMVGILRPKMQFIHDATDFTGRNHHNIKDPHFRYKMWKNGTESVAASMAAVGDFLVKTKINDCVSIVVESNHDLAVQRWLKESDWKTDPVNALFYLEAQLALLKSIDDPVSFSVLEWAVCSGNWGMFDDVIFLREDDSFPICNGAIECAMHGHLGSNGSKGSPKQYTKMGPKANTAHTHSPGIADGIYTAGTNSKLDLGYNRGLSSWANADILTYGNAKRTIITKMNGKWFAE